MYFRLVSLESHFTNISVRLNTFDLLPEVEVVVGVLRVARHVSAHHRDTLPPGGLDNDL